MVQECQPNELGKGGVALYWLATSSFVENRDRRVKIKTGTQKKQKNKQDLEACHEEKDVSMNERGKCISDSKRGKLILITPGTSSMEKESGTVA